MSREQSVEEYLASLEHPLRSSIAALRAAILACDPAITEHVKWRAPSFVHDGVDRVTFRLQPGALFQVVLHRGVAVRADAESFVFEDPSGLVTWLSPDRGLVDLSEPGAAERHTAQVVALVQRWVRA